MLTRGVPDNHAETLGRGLNYPIDKVILLPTSSIEEHMPEIGLSPDSTRISKDTKDVRGYIWMMNMVNDYDVHFIDGTHEQSDPMADHWRAIADNLAGRSRFIKPQYLHWQYDPFEYGHKSLEGYFPDWSERKRKEILTKALDGNRLPHAFGYAAATLLEARGELEAASMEFGFPAKLRFRRSYKRGELVDSYGDQIEAATIVRSLRQPTTPSQDSEIKVLSRRYQDAVNEGRVPLTRDLDLEEALLAPVYNSL